MMKKFIFKIAFLIILVILFMSLFLNKYGAYVDPFYDKFTTPKQNSMILGDSRSMQGLQPSIIDSCLVNDIYKLPTYNFSFTIEQIAYGPSYLEAIKRKLDTTYHNQLFIVTVSPWMLANRNPKLELESDSIFTNSPPHNMNYMTSKPNAEYLIKNFDFFKFDNIFTKNNKLHKNGWSEVHIDNCLKDNNTPKNIQLFLERKQSQIELFNGKATKWKPSKYRLNWLNKTILYLQKHGTVILVRMPIDKEILKIENDFWNEFDREMYIISGNLQINYFTFPTSTWSTFDGHHLDLYNSKIFTIKLSELIKENNPTHE